MHPSLRRKFITGNLFSAAMKPAVATSAARKGGNLSVFVVVISVFIFGCFMYNEDVKSIAEFPFSRPKAQESENDIAAGDKTAAVSVVVNARTVVETELAGSAVGNEDDRKQEVDSINLKSNVSENEEEEEKKIEENDDEEEEEEEEIVIPPEECDLFTGEWVLDNVTHPLYKEDECEFLTAQVTCMRNGRKDSLYQNWRWQPRDCSLPK